MAARKIRDKARKIAAHLLEVAEEDLEWEPGKFVVKGAPDRSRRPSRRSRSPRTPTTRRGWRRGWRRSHYYDPPNLTFPFGSYICVVDIDQRHRAR